MDKTNINEPVLTGNDILNGNYDGKQKQIDEMARLIKPIIVSSSLYCEGNNDQRQRAKEKIKKQSLRNAETLYSAGYRKIPELPKNTVLTADDIAELLTIVARDTRKETVEKFAEKLKEKRFDEYSPEGKCYECVAVSDIDETCKEFTEGEYGESLCEE